MSENFYAIRNINANASSWTAVTAPIACCSWSISANANILVSTNQVDTDTLPAGDLEYVPKRSIPGEPYPINTTFCYVKAVSGTAVVTARFAQ